MRRREFISLLGGMAFVKSVVLAIPAIAQQPGKVPRVGILTPAETDATPIFGGLRGGLRDMGYIEGATIVLEFRFAKGNLDALPGLAEELVRLPVDLIVTDGNNAARAALDATRTVPIVMGIAADALESGLVPSTARPGGNITGMTLGRIEQAGKRLQLLMQAFPGISRVVVLLNPSALSGQLNLRVTEDAAKTLGMTVSPLAANNPDELRALEPRRLLGADGLVVLPDAMFWNHRATITGLVNAARVPALYPEREYADDGGLIAYGPNIPDSFRRAAGYVARILRGTKPGDLPIDEASKFDFVINLRTARALGIAISPDFLSSANEVIE
ncbi:MAG TPA: ABC transporter substrate-binding protein [Xanthobacteraceae bacterium]|nr:ABC transporter substrate-binding protein [Xanthobacteraceae bacterium]